MPTTLKGIAHKTAFPLCAAFAFTLLPSIAFAGGEDIFGAASPFEAFTNFLTGPFAYFVAIIGIVVFGAMLVSGSDFSGLSRRAPMILLAIGIILGAKTIIDKLYGGAAGASYSIEDVDRSLVAPDVMAESRRQ